MDNTAAEQAAQRKHSVLQNAVEGTHMDSVKAAPKLNRSTTLLTGSAAYSLQDTLHQCNLDCSNHGWLDLEICQDSLRSCQDGQASHLTKLTSYCSDDHSSLKKTHQKSLLCKITLYEYD